MKIEAPCYHIQSIIAIIIVFSHKLSEKADEQS